MRRLPVLLILILGLAGCGYFNSLYNANRRFADAQRAEARGDQASARSAYRETIEKAGASYRGHPDGRWSDDALVLVGRARFALRENVAAAAAMRHVLARNGSAEHRSIAAAYLGAALVRMDSIDAALPYLDQAVAGLRSDDDVGAFARLWLARAAFAAGRPDEAWPHLAYAAEHRHTGMEAALETAARAVQHRDSARLRSAFTRLAGIRDVQLRLDTVEALVRRGAEDWAPEPVLAASAPLDRTLWRADAADRMALVRAGVAAQAGHVGSAIEIATRVAGSQTGAIASRARLLAARWRLAHLNEPRELEEIHALLLPAFENFEALSLLRRVRATQLLISRGTTAESSLYLFAAAELARDDLGAPRLARRLFLDFAALAPESAWAGKAALAAHDAAPDSATASWLARLRGNPYIVAVAGDDPGEEYTRAELRLARGLSGIQADALAEVILRDVSLRRALSTLDSTRAAARSDSIRIACGELLDSLALRGVRADSSRAACLRGDSARLQFVLEADSAALLTSGRTPPRTTRPDVQSPLPDTTGTP